MSCLPARRESSDRFTLPRLTLTAASIGRPISPSLPAPNRLVIAAGAIGSIGSRIIVASRASETFDLARAARREKSSSRGKS